MSRLQKDSTIPSVASTSQEDQESRTLKVTLLSSEWRSSTDGDLSTINQELAIQLAKHPNVDVSILLPKCSGEDRSCAESHNVKLIEADAVPGVEPVLCLSFPPINHTMDCVIGHGVHLGRPAALIKRNPIFSHCKWIQVVHSAPEEDGMYKNISESEKMHETEIELCKMADQVITIGPKLAEAYKRYLRPVKQEENVFDLTPSIFSEFLEVEQATEERSTFCILVIGGGDSCEDFNVKGYDITAKAIAELKDETYQLKFVYAAGGKGDIVAEKLLHHGIRRNQLIVSSIDDSRKVLADLFCEVDLAIRPSRTEGFGITALKALSAGLPVLVSGNSGLGEALRKVPLGSQSVVDSEDPNDWAKEIKRVRLKERDVRLSESRLLREKYLKKYSWEEPCKSLVIKMRNLVFGGSEQVICNLQQCQQNAGRCKISSNTDRLSDLKEIASGKGYRISDNVGSGNCMFYALSEQLATVKGVKINHIDLRQLLVQYLRKHPKNVHGTDLFHFVDGHATWGGYLTDMAQDGTWGDHVILWAAANCYQIAIHVISSLPGHSEVIIKPDCPFDKSKHLALGHVHEVHYVSLQPSQDSSEIRATLLGKDKRKASISADQPHKRLREELTNHDYYEGSFSYGLPAPVAANYSQGNLCAPSVNLNFQQDEKLNIKVDVEELKPKETNIQTTKIAVLHTEGSDMSHSGTKDCQAGGVLSSIASNYLKTTPPQSREEHNTFKEYLREMRVIITGVSEGSLVITVMCESLQSLEKLWTDYSSGHLGEMVQNCFVTEKILKEHNLTELKLKTTIDIEEYNASKVYFERVAHRGPENGERLITEIQTNSFLDAQWNNPLNLSLLCTVFEDTEGELPSHRTELYQIIVCCLLRRYCAKHNLEAPADDKALTRHFEDSLLVLGELAWRCLKEDRFSFREEELVEFESTHESLAARKLGLVFKEASLRKINPQHEYFFFHKTFQEYLAAFYLAHMLLKQMVDFSELNFYGDLVERYRQVFVFMSGILGGEAGVLFEQIGKKLKDENWDWCECSGEEASFFHECFSESRNYEQVAMALCSFIPFPQTITIDLSDEKCTTEWFIILNACTSSSQLQLPVHLAIRSVFDNVQANVNNDLLADFVAFNTSLQTLSFSVRFMIEEIATLLCRLLRMDSTAYSFTLEVTCSNISSVGAISDSLAANKTLTTITFQLPCKFLEEYVAILDKGLSADTPLTYIVLKTFGPCTETEAELLRKILLNRSLTSQSLAVGGKMHDSLATSVSEGLVANSSPKSLALIFCGKLSYSGLSVLKEGFLGNRSLESLQLKVFGELPTNWANICGTLQSAIKSTTSFTVYPDITGMVGNSQVAFLCPVLKENISASKLHSVTVNIWGELDCSGATDLCKLLIASLASCVNLSMNGRITDSVADCLFRHFNKLDTLSYLSIDIRGEVMGDGKKTLQRLSSNQIYFFAFNVHSFNSGNKICREVCLSTDDSSPITPVFAKVKDGCVTKLNVSINNPGNISEDWKCNLFEGLAKNECVTTLNLVFNNTYLLANIDAFKINNYSEMRGDLTGVLGDSLGKNTSLTTLSLTFNNYSYMIEDSTGGLGDGLGKNTSLTTLSLTVNNYSDMGGDLTRGLGDGLGKNTSLTTLSLTVNNYSDMGELWTRGLGDGLGKNTSLTTLSLTFNNYSEIRGEWTRDLGDGLAKNTSVVTLNLTLSNWNNLYEDWVHGLVDGLVTNMSSTAISLEVNIFGEGNEKSESILV